jgi:hypothetical protein
MSELECPSGTTDINKGIINSIKNFFNNKSEVVCNYKSTGNFPDLGITLSRKIDKLNEYTKYITGANKDNSLFLYFHLLNADFSYISKNIDILKLVVQYVIEHKYKYIFISNDNIDTITQKFITQYNTNNNKILNHEYNDNEKNKVKHKMYYIELKPNDTNFKQKYLKYKQKYLQLRKELNQI